MTKRKIHGTTKNHGTWAHGSHFFEMGLIFMVRGLLFFGKWAPGCVKVTPRSVELTPESVENKIKKSRSVEATPG
jgi:hypothetical protein